MGLMPQQDPGSCSLVGRSAELARLRAALADAADGRGSAVLIAGEAGIGKTRLIGELAESAREAGGTVLLGRCIDLVGPDVPYFALLEAVGSHPDAERAGDLRHLAKVGSADADAQFQVFEQLRTMMDEISAAAPLILLIEDLHWGDGSTLDFVGYLSRCIRNRPMLLVGTYRSDDVRPGDRLAHLVVELIRARDALVLELPALGPDELRQLLENKAGRRLPIDLIDAVAARSSGNPFFAEELLAAVDRGEQALPRLLRDVLLQRVVQIDPAGQAVLRVAAGIGRDVPYLLLARLTALPEPRLAQALRQSVEHGVLVPDRAAAAYRFRHALLAEVVYSTILPGEAEQLHERIARALTDHDGLDGELARHWYAAGRPVEALGASARAARAAEAVCGLAEALHHLERVLELWPAVPAAAELTGMNLATALTRAAELADLTGRGRRAAELVRQAASLIDADAELVRAALLEERLGSYLLPLGEHRAALDACRRAADLVPERPPSAERARVLTSLANALMLSCRHAESLPVCRAALATAEAIGDPRPALRAQNILGINLWHLGRPDEAHLELVAARERALERGTSRDIAHSHVALCEVLLLTARPDEAANVAQEGMVLAHQWGVERSFGVLLAAYAAEAALETGDWDRADDLLADAHRSGTAFWAHYPRLLHAQLASARGDFAAAREHLEIGAQGKRQPTSTARYARVVAELALWEGRPDDAATAIDAALARAEIRRSPRHRVSLATLGLRAQADRAQGTAERAVQLLGVALRAAAEAARLTTEAAAWKVLAEAEHSRIGHNQDPDRWRTAVAAWDKLDRPYPAAYCRYRLAEALLGRARDTDEAVQSAREGYRMAAALRALPLRRELQSLAQRGRLDLVGLPAPARRGRASGLGLTDRESQVLLLLARGYTNREIATELTISTKTASVHVSHILRKLGVPRRFDAAAIAHRVGLESSGLR